MGIMTKTGDEGATGLFSGERVPKDDPRIEALGELDSFSSFLGFARLACRLEETRLALEGLQADLYRVAAELGSGGAKGAPAIVASDEASLAVRIAELEGRIPLRGFVLPGRTEASARIDIARASARSLERRAIAASKTPGAPAASLPLLAYLNRLSDYLFMLARAEEAAEDKIEYLKSR
jgi:cob(I)alamin adenosyltransferase